MDNQEALALVITIMFAFPMIYDFAISGLHAIQYLCEYIGKSFKQICNKIR